MLSNPVQSDLNSFIDTSRTQRVQSMISQSPRSNSYYPQFETQSEINFNPTASLRAYSPDDLQKLKYKIDLGSIICFFYILLLLNLILDKQVEEKQQRRVREWESKIQQDRKYVNRNELSVLFVFI